jgi:hypothetical protein
MNKKSYFGIIAIATAMLGATVLSSCNHDDYYYSEEKVELSANDKYAAAFEKAFGKVGPNVDWGFSSKHAKARAITRAGDNFQPTISFPEDLGADNFTIPEGTQPMPNGEGGIGPYYIDETTEQVWSWSGQCVIYVKGNVDLTDKKFQVNTGTKIYLTQNSTLKLGSYSADGLNVAFYIAKNATLETTGLLKVQSYPVYNHGTINVGSYELCSSSLLYNVGSIETTGDLRNDNSTCKIVNDGDITSGSVHIEGGGALQNNADWTVTGTTVVNCIDGGWVNNGHWTTRNYAYTGGSVNVINNCYLEVTNDFDMNISSNKDGKAFKIDTNGGVVTNNFYGGRDTSSDPVATSGPYKIVMGQGAVFKVTGTATLEGGNPGWGFFGPSEGEYAVFQAKNIVRNSIHEGTHGAVTYGGNLYVSAETHFAQGYDSDGSGSVEPKPFIYVEGEVFDIKTNIFAAGTDFSTGKPNITIPETPCNPGFIGGNPLYRVIAEDLSAEEAGDFDFNDVVFDVVKAENQKTTLRLICAGGVLPLRVRGANEAEGVEVHSVFGGTPNTQGRYQMYNTGAGPTVPETEFTVEGEYTTPEQIKNIIIEVQKGDIWMPLNATTGKAACKILVDDTFKPVRERRNIADENQNFTNYVQGEFVDEFWWK